MKYSEIIEILANRVINHFDEVYYGAELVTVDNKKFPAVIAGDEWIDLSPTDQKETIYIRRAGDDSVEHTNNIGSCAIGYKMITPLRIVFFKDHEQFPDQVLFKLLKIALTPKTRLRSIIRDKFRLAKEETSGEYGLGASTAYLAIDIYAIWDLLPESCDESDLCISIDNPLKKCTTTINNNS